MRFLLIVKATAASEAGEMPSAEAMRAMGAFNEELVAAGVLIDVNGLQSSAEGFRYLAEGDEVRIVDGPFAETKELIAGYWMIQAKSLEEAVAWAKRSPLDVDGSPGEIEIRQIFELEDFPEQENESGWRENEERLREEWNAGSPTEAQGTMAPTPGKLIYMGLVHSSEESEAGVMPAEEELATMGSLMEESAAAGILLGGEGLTPSSQGVRVKFENGERTVVDGPFTETKELIGGYAIMQFDDEAQAREWTLRFAKTSGQQCVEVRKVFRPEDFSDELRTDAADVFEAEQSLRARVAERRA